MIEAWQASAALHEFRAPIRDDELQAAEAELGRPIPAELRALYAFSDGLTGFHGNLQIESARAAVDLGAEMNTNGWNLPAELFVFGGNGSDEHYALWYPPDASSEAPTPVVEIGEIFEPGCLALTGSSFAQFLRTMTGFHLALAGAPVAAMDALAMPARLRMASESLEPWVRWSDPSLPFLNPDPYLQRLTPSQIRGYLT